MLTFRELGLSPQLLRGIEKLGFQHPTPVQEQIIPLALAEKRDIVGLAQTGTGKTAAFGLPVLEQTDPQVTQVQTLILSPTRELCMQITEDLYAYSQFMDKVRIVAVYGGANIDTQIKSLRKGAHIVVATPGRLLDLLKRKVVHLNQLRNLVLDEADEMLNMGFRDDLNAILEGTPPQRRTLLFSATLPKEVARIAGTYMNNPEEVVVGTRNAGAENVQHVYYQVSARNRYLTLKRIADIHPNIYGIVFCRTRRETKEVAEKLIKDGYNADALHGDLSQAQRDQVMRRFRSKSLQMLVATDVAARGIDVDNVSHVINYNMPDDLDVYTHRSGRTGRADKTGVSMSIVNLTEKNKIHHLEKNIGKEFKRLLVPTGEEVCQKQLFKLIDKMENVEVDEKQISPFMDEVSKKLEWLSKEEIIKRFISLEFNRFLEYYKNAPDLNERPKTKDKKEKYRQSIADKEDGKPVQKNQYIRFYINLGRKDKLIPTTLIGMINEYTRTRGIDIGAIDIKDSFSFFEIEEKYAAVVLNSFPKNKTFSGRKIRIDFAGEEIRENKPPKRNKQTQYKKKRK